MSDGRVGKEKHANFSKTIIQISVQGMDSLSSPAAVLMFDASGKIPDGISVGNTYALGSYEACIQVLYCTSSTTR